MPSAITLEPMKIFINCPLIFLTELNTLSKIYLTLFACSLVKVSLSSILLYSKSFVSYPDILKYVHG